MADPKKEKSLAEEIKEIVKSGKPITPEDIKKIVDLIKARTEK